MIDFPASPTLGQQFTAAGVTWTWDGAKWLPAGLSPTVVGGINDNRIINGDMRIDQRGIASGAGGTAASYTVDRWQFLATQASKGIWSRANFGAFGFPYALLFGSSSAYTPLTGDTFVFVQLIESDMVSGRICHNRLCFALRCPHSPRTSGSGSRRVRCCSSARSRRPQLKGIAFYDIGVGMARA